MEDAHAAVLNLDEGKSEEDTNAFFAVYDGHGGMTLLPKTATFLPRAELPAPRVLRRQICWPERSQTTCFGGGLQRAQLRAGIEASIPRHR